LKTHTVDVESIKKKTRDGREEDLSLTRTLFGRLPFVGGMRRKKVLSRENVLLACCRCCVVDVVVDVVVETDKGIRKGRLTPTRTLFGRLPFVGGMRREKVPLDE
jgi:hypothetical protein